MSILNLRVVQIRVSVKNSATLDERKKPTLHPKPKITPSHQPIPGRTFFEGNGKGRERIPFCQADEGDDGRGGMGYETESRVLREFFYFLFFPSSSVPVRRPSDRPEKYWFPTPITTQAKISSSQATADYIYIYPSKSTRIFTIKPPHTRSHGSLHSLFFFLAFLPSPVCVFALCVCVS